MTRCHQASSQQRVHFEESRPGRTAGLCGFGWSLGVILARHRIFPRRAPYTGRGDAGSTVPGFPDFFLRFGRRPPTGCARTVPVRRADRVSLRTACLLRRCFTDNSGFPHSPTTRVPRAFLIVVGKSPQPRRILDRYICLRSLAENTMTGHSSRFPCSRVGNPGQKSNVQGVVLAGPLNITMVVRSHWTHLGL